MPPELPGELDHLKFAEELILGIVSSGVPMNYVHFGYMDNTIFRSMTMLNTTAESSGDFIRRGRNRSVSNKLHLLLLL